MIDDRYADAFGNPVIVSDATMAAMRDALGEETGDAPAGAWCGSIGSMHPWRSATTIT